jgi:hypothetical protein
VLPDFANSRVLALACLHSYAGAVFSANLNLDAEARNMTATTILLAQRTDEVSPIGGIFWLILAIAFIAGLWATFVKAGKPGWAAIIPIYNVIVLLDVAGRPLWWIFLFLIPIVNIIVAIVVGTDVARNFGKGTGFGIGLAILGFIFYPILGFGDAVYYKIAH